MGFFSGLFGGGQRKDIERGRQAATGYVNDYYDRGRDSVEDYYGRSMKFLEPQLAAGENARGVYESALGLRGEEAQQDYFDSFNDDPGFQSELNQGQRAVESNAAARGYSLSGRALKELQDFGQQHRRSAYDKRLDRLSGLSDKGGQVALGAANLTAATGKDLAQSFYGQGGTLGNIELTSANARANTRFSLGDLGNIIGGAAKMYSVFK